MDLSFDKIKAAFRKPRILLAALLINYLVIPLIFVALITLARLDGMWAVGLLFVAAAPGGPVAGVLVQNARGNLALGVSILVLMNVLNTVLTPLGVWVLDALPSANGGRPPILGMVQTIIIYQILPLFLAMLFRQQWEEVADRLQPVLERAAKGLLMFVALAMLVVEFERMKHLPLALLVVIHIAVIISLAVGWWLSPGSRNDKIAVSLTAPYRSISVVLLLLSAWVRDADALLSAMAYSVAMLWISGAASIFIRRRQSH